MIRFARRHRLIILSTVLLVLSAVAGQAVHDRFASYPTLSSQDAGGDGSLALALWLDQLGYPVNRLESGGAQLAPNGLLLVLAPSRPFTPSEVQATLDWVRSGGVLVYLPSFAPSLSFQPTPGGDSLARELGVVNRFGPPVEGARGSGAYFTAPPARAFSESSRRTLELADDAWVPLITDGDRVIAATRALGQGRVYVTSAAALFSNQGIGKQDNANFLLNVLAHHPQVRAVSIDEYHHTPIEAPSLAQEFRAAPWGWAIMYAALVTFLFVLWGGRRFGPALVPVQGPRRSAGDYVTSFAGLLQRARAANWAQTQYAALVRRRLGRTLGVRWDLPAAQLAGMAASRFPVDSGELASALTAIDGAPLGERRLLSEIRSIEQQLRAMRSGG